jgi:hypothetical protein
MRTDRMEEPVRSTNGSDSGDQYDLDHMVITGANSRHTYVRWNLQPKVTPVPSIAWMGEEQGGQKGWE